MRGTAAARERTGLCRDGDRAGFPRHPPAPTDSPTSVAQLAESGHCRAALPRLKAALTRARDPELEKRLGVHGVHCAMSLNDADSAEDFVRALKKALPARSRGT